MLWTGDFTRYFVARIGFVLAAWLIPFLGIILFGGVVADRIGARPLMFGPDLVRLIAQGVAAAFFAGHPSPWLLTACSAVSGAAAAMFQPGVDGIVPQGRPRRQLRCEGDREGPADAVAAGDDRFLPS